MFANLVLYTWPIIARVFFQKFSPTLAVLLTLVAGYLLLPGIPGLDLPILPTLNNDSIPTLAAILFGLTLASSKTARDSARGWFPKAILARLLLVGLVLGIFGTTLTNLEPYRFLQGMRPYDAFAVLSIHLVMLGPFFLAYRFVASPEQQKICLATLAIAGFAYSFLALLEIRLSPRLNVWIYGYFPHSWQQHIRDGGFRPLVFLQHGLWLGIFFAMAAIAAFGAAKSYRKYRIHFLIMGCWISGTLALSNTLGALAILVPLAGISLFLTKRLQLAIATAVAIVVLCFPVLRERGVVTGDAVVTWASKISTDRALSMQFRLDNENLLLNRSNEKPLFGWGGYARGRVYDEKGNDITITDGFWIITFSQGGWFRYISTFGLLTLPVVFMFLRRKQHSVGIETVTIALALSANLIDLLPNGTQTPITWLLAGSLWGRLEWRESQKDPDELDSGKGDITHEAQSVSVYTRQKSNVTRTRFR